MSGLTTRRRGRREEKLEIVESEPITFSPIATATEWQNDS